jgi:RNA polymerase sigma-70 factor (ECF subfamily)
MKESALPLSESAGSADDGDLERAVAGDRQAFDRLVLRHQQAVVNSAAYILGNYQDALEVSQDAFLKAYRGLSSFRGTASFRTWMLRITVNTARSFQARRRAKKRRGNRRHLSVAPGGGDDPAVDIPDTSAGPESLLLRKEVKEAIEKAIVDLEPDAREVIVLRDISGESYEDIASALDLPLGTVKSKVHRARLQLREKLAPLL